MKRCSWCNEKNPLYVKYHDEEWGKPRFDDPYLFEMLILEGFQAGLSWECVLNKRENFRNAFEKFELENVMHFDEEKILSLKADKGIVRNERKIRAAVSNARIFRDIVNEYGSFYNYLRLFWNGEQIKETGKTTSPLSDAISSDLIKRGMKFCGSVIIYSYLQAVGGYQFARFIVRIECRIQSAECRMKRSFANISKSRGRLVFKLTVL